MTTESRVEHDSMGALDVPAIALWGAQSQRPIQDFPPSGLRMPPALIRAVGLIKPTGPAADTDERPLDAPTGGRIKGAGSCG
jgi:fumarate hydratase class II